MPTATEPQQRESVVEGDNDNADQAIRPERADETEAPECVLVRGETAHHYQGK